MNQPSSCRRFRGFLPSALRGRAQAVATISGSEDYPNVSGTMRLYQTWKGVVVYAEVSGLPQSDRPCQGRIFGFHIHEGIDCGGNMDDPLAAAMAYYDPDGCGHPYHAGDLPPLFGNNGFAVCAFLTNRFSADEVIGRAVIIHDHPDDFTTQPSGNSGTKIACGVIRQAEGSCF